MDGATASPPLVIPGGSNPDWGLADVPAARPDDGPKPDAAKLAVTVKKGGLKLKVTVPSAGRLAASAKGKGAVLARAKSRAVQPGTRALTLKLTKAGRRALKRNGTAKVTVRVSYTPQGGAKQVVKRAAKIKRR